jgi:hypothetical protein
MVALLAIQGFIHASRPEPFQVEGDITIPLKPLGSHLTFKDFKDDALLSSYGKTLNPKIRPQELWD